jgi:hypothetical protein
MLSHKSGYKGAKHLYCKHIHNIYEQIFTYLLVSEINDTPIYQNLVLHLVCVGRWHITLHIDQLQARLNTTYSLC